MAQPNLANVNTYYLRSKVVNVTTSLANVLTNFPDSNGLVKLNSLTLVNDSASATANVNVILYNSVGEQTNLATKLLMPPGNVIYLSNKLNEISLFENTTIKANADSNNVIDMVISYEEISDKIPSTYQIGTNFCLLSLEYVMIAGGGGGGIEQAPPTFTRTYGGGGGAGGLTYGCFTMPTSNVTVIVGAGGAGAPSSVGVPALPGGNSTINYSNIFIPSGSLFITSFGGGRGGASFCGYPGTGNYDPAGFGGDGGSGGGGGFYSSPGFPTNCGIGGNSICGQGGCGAIGRHNPGVYAHGGGGGGAGSNAAGASLAGGSGSSTYTSILSDARIGVFNSPDSKYYIGGGGGSNGDAPVGYGGPGGLGGGGGGGVSGTVNTGSGGGSGASGGSGMAIIRYPGCPITLGGNSFYCNNYTYHVFRSSGNISLCSSTFLSRV